MSDASRYRCEHGPVLSSPRAARRHHLRRAAGRPDSAEEPVGRRVRPARGAGRADHRRRGALVAGIIWGIQQVTLVIIPLVLALIFASAFGPVTMWMRRKGVPAVIATLLTLLAVVVVLAGLGWLVANASSTSGTTSARRPCRASSPSQDWYHTLPFAISQDQSIRRSRVFRASLDELVLRHWRTRGRERGRLVVTGFVLMVRHPLLLPQRRPAHVGVRPSSVPRQRLRADAPHRRQDGHGARSYVRGTASVAAVDAIGIGIGLAILQVPLALPLAVSSSCSRSSRSWVRSPPASWPRSSLWSPTVRSWPSSSSDSSCS